MSWDDEDGAQPWWTAHGAMLTLLEYLADQPAYSKADLVAAMEKPWKYAPEYQRALAAREEVQR